MQNVEFKCELRDLGLARGVCERIGATRVGTVRQRDVYYRVADGRLKRREVSGEPVEYIFYHRPNRLRPKLSHYTIYDHEAAVKRFGKDLPIWVTVDKQREIWLYKNVRIHLDEVAGLGRFLELEALVGPSCHVGQCHHLVNEIRRWFGHALGEPISMSYSDMVDKEVTSEQ